MHANAVAHLLACPPGSPTASELEREIARLEGDRQRLHREAAHAPADVAHNLTPDAMVEQLGALLADLRQALCGPEREAVRAKDLLRGMIDKVTVVPVSERPAPTVAARAPCLPHSRGQTSPRCWSWPRPTSGRVILEGSGPRTLLDEASYKFRFYVDLEPGDLRFVAGLAADVGAISRLLDPGDVPVTRPAMLEALSNRRRNARGPRCRAGGPRQLNAMMYLRRRGLVRWVRVTPPERSGYVWDHYPFTDDEWATRANMVAHHGHYPLPIIRFWAPEAKVGIIIGPAPKPVRSRSRRSQETPAREPEEEPCL